MKTYQSYVVRSLCEEEKRAALALCSSTSLNISQHLATLLVLRGVKSTEQATSYLNPQLHDLPDANTLKGIHKAASLIVEAVKKKHHIAIQGDYDVDGITGTALLLDFFELCNLKCHVHLPNRLHEGYGLSVDSINALAEKSEMPALLITVDNGISSVKEVRYAKKIGFKVIVTDHHLPGKTIPEADAVVNPKQAGCSFTESDISGVGVAFFVVMAARRQLVENGFWTKKSMPNLKNILDLVALGTVADVMKLQGVNRILVKSGLEILSKRQRPGIQALCGLANIEEQKVCSEDISFKLAPRINAAGRLGKPFIAQQLLVAKESSKALAMAKTLEETNARRREIEEEVLVNALKEAEKQVVEGKNGIVVYGEQWHQGVLGIIASRVKDKFNFPVFVLTKTKDNTYKGSGRSVKGLNLYNILSECDDLLEKFGGHAMAAGLTLPAENIALFAKRFNKVATENIHHHGVDKNELMVDMVIDDTVGIQNFVGILGHMEPFGKGNHEPVFLLKSIQLEKVSMIREHLRFFVQINATRIQGIGFFMAHLYELTAGPVDLCLKLKQTTYKGRQRVEVQAVGIFPTN